MTYKNFSSSRISKGISKVAIGKHFPLGDIETVGRVNNFLSYPLCTHQLTDNELINFFSLEYKLS